MLQKGARLRLGSLAPPDRASRGPPSCEQEGNMSLLGSDFYITVVLKDNREGEA